MIKACVFDAYGTLFNLDVPHAPLKAALQEQAPALLDLWRRKQLEYTWLRTLMNRYAPFEQVTEDALKFAFEAFEVEDKSLFEALMQTYWQPTLYPDVKDALQALKEQGKGLAILSNGSPSLLKSGLKHTGLTELFDQVISAHSVSKFKVHPNVYQLAEDTLEYYPDELSFQSANAWDIIGATTYGFTTVWINRRGQQLDRLGIDPDHQLKDLIGLPKLVQNL